MLKSQKTTIKKNDEKKEENEENFCSYFRVQNRKGERQTDSSVGKFTIFLGARTQLECDFFFEIENIKEKEEEVDGNIVLLFFGMASSVLSFAGAVEF